MIAALIIFAAIDCPSAEAVERRINSMRAPDAGPLPYRIEVRHGESEVRVAALTHDGQTWLERSLPASVDCDRLEKAAAVVLLAWETQQPPAVPQVTEAPP